MAHVTYSELRANLARLMEQVCDSHAPLTVTRQNARSVVMLAEDDYESLLETAQLLRSPPNSRRLLESIAQAGSGALTEHELIDPEPTPRR